MYISKQPKTPSKIKIKIINKVFVKICLELRCFCCCMSFLLARTTLATKIFISILTMDTKHLRRYQYWRSCERINIDEVANDYDEKKHEL